MTNKACVKCEYWKRDGSNGICFGGTPQPAICEEGKEYMVVWPRTNPDEYCPEFTDTGDMN